MIHSNPFDAELHGWLIVMHPSSKLTWPTIVGVVQNDRKGRLADGRAIQTSALLTPIEQVQAGAIVCTLNSRYLLVGPPAERN